MLYSIMMQSIHIKTSDAKEVARALKALDTGFSSSLITQSFNYVKIKTDKTNSKLSFVINSLQSNIKAEIDARYAEEVEDKTFVLEKKFLSSILNSSGDMVELQLEGQSVLLLSGKSKYTFSLSVADTNLFIEPKPKTIIEIDRNNFCKALREVIDCTGDTGAITGICLRNDENGVTFACATNSFIASVSGTGEKLDIPEEHKGNFIIPKNSAAKIISYLSTLEDDKVKIWFSFKNKGFGVLVNDKIQFSVNFLVGIHPDLFLFFPRKKANPTKLTVQSSDLDSSIRRFVNAFGSLNNSEMNIRSKKEEGKILLQLNQVSITGLKLKSNLLDEIDAHIDGDDFNININVPYFQKISKHFIGEIEILIGDINSPIFISSTNPNESKESFMVLVNKNKETGN